MKWFMEILKETPKEELYPQESFKVYKYEDNVPYKIKKDGNIWVVSGKEIETLLLMTKFNEDEGVLRFARKFKGMGIEDELEKMGAKVGWSPNPRLYVYLQGLRHHRFLNHN